MIYMLNLVFDGSDTTESNNGRFKEYDSTQSLLQQSQVWLKQSNPANPTPNPDVTTDWTSLQDDNAGPLKGVVNDQVWVRILGANASGFCARMTTIVARDAKKASKGNNGKALQQRGSPFPLTSTESCVLYDTEDPTYQAPSTAGSWVTKLGVVTFSTTPPTPPPQNFHDSYSMIVALTTGVGQPGNSDPSNVRTYAHDPEMEIDYNG